jgi:hypothetical protein
VHEDVEAPPVRVRRIGEPVDGAKEVVARDATRARERQGGQAGVGAAVDPFRLGQDVRAVRRTGSGQGRGEREQTPPDWPGADTTDARTVSREEDAGDSREGPGVNSSAANP